MSSTAAGIPSSDGTLTGLDGSSASWFAAFCGGLTAVTDAQNQVEGINVGDAADMQAAMIGILTPTTAIVSAAATQISTLPPPAVVPDPTFSANVTREINQRATTLAAALQTLTSASPEDTTVQGDVVGQVATAATQAGIDIASFTALKVSPSTREAIVQLPSCTSVLR